MAAHITGKQNEEYAFCTDLLKTTKVAVSVAVWARFMAFWIMISYHLFLAGSLKSHIRLPCGSYVHKLNYVCIWKCFVFGMSGKGGWATTLLHCRYIEVLKNLVKGRQWAVISCCCGSFLQGWFETCWHKWYDRNVSISDVLGLVCFNTNYWRSFYSLEAGTYLTFPIKVKSSLQYWMPGWIQVWESSTELHLYALLVTGDIKEKL